MRSFIFMDWRHLGEMQAAGDAVFSELKNVCVWAKDRAGMGSLYRSRHELIFVWKAGRDRHRNNVELGRNGRHRTNVWEYPGIGTFRHSDEGDLLRLHPTVKPVRMIADAILDVTARGDIVLDPFMGSGTTIIAAERVGRRAYGMELELREQGYRTKRRPQADGSVKGGIPFERGMLFHLLGNRVYVGETVHKGMLAALANEGVVGAAAVARALNARGVPAPGGGAWCPAQARRVVRGEDRPE